MPYRGRGPIHLGHGQGQIIIDERASPAQREALLRFLSGHDAQPGATVFQVFSTTLDKVHAPHFSKGAIDINVEQASARIEVEGWVEPRGDTILNPITRQQYRAQAPSGRL